MGTQSKRATIALRMMLRRLGRLWPLHVTMLLIFIVIEAVRLVDGNWQGQAPFTGSHSPFTIFADATFLTSWGGAFLGAFPWDPPSWSISAEFYTYATFAVVCLITQNKRYFLSFFFLFLHSLCSVFIALTTQTPPSSSVLLDASIVFLFGAIIYEIYRTTTVIPKRFSTAIELITIIIAAVFINMNR